MALYYTGKGSSLKTKRLEEEKAGFIQKVAEVPINPSQPSPGRAGGQQHGGSRACCAPAVLLQPSAAGPGTTPERVFRLKDAGEVTLP